MNNPSSSPSIKTDIFDFCQSFAGILTPFAKSLDSVRTGIKDKGDAEVLQRPLAAFSDIHHRLESLINKVAEQQAYLIIFGPLKSGKSTLMNAISAAYVSEVTSLPAYPCLVHVKHGEDYSFVATRYSGEKLKFSDNASLQFLIKQSHETLAARLREVEEMGEKFDPGVHYPDAIRRVDVAVPTRNLRDSLTVMVDTPGLYTRMKFGYDLMTREFRNSAACAVFVVKTDNLFLEQVFEEFNQLLDLFSRIFLVVNIDTNKRDLDPDGSLKPSLESKSPGEVIRAFESLVMSAPLRRAQQEGRLKIYPIDLLNSAAIAMKGAHEVPAAVVAPVVAAADAAATDEVPAPEEAAPTSSDDPLVAEPTEPAAESAAIEDSAATEEAAEATPEQAAESAPLAVPSLPAFPTFTTAPPVLWSPPVAPTAFANLPAIDAPPASDTAEPAVADAVMPATWSARPEASFSLFLKDLTDYLNSSEYLQEFMGDALLMGTNLGLEIQDHCSPKATEDFAACQQQLEADLADTAARLAAVEKLESLDLKASFSPLQQQARQYAEEVSKAAAAEAQQKSLKCLDDWFAADHSVADLQADWAGYVQACGKRVSSECHAKVRSLVASPLGGIRIDDNLRSSAVGLDELVGPVVAAARSTLAAQEPALRAGPFKIEQEHLKVRRSLWDWLAFRSLAAVRRKVFGAPDALDLAVPAPLKDKRLGAEGKQALKDFITSELSKQFPGEAVRLSETLLTQYVETLSQELGAKLQAGREKYASRKAELTRRIEDNRAIRETLENLTDEASGVLTEVDKLRRKYHTYSRVNSGVIDLATAAEAAPDEADEDMEDMEDFAFADNMPAEMPTDCGCHETAEEAELDPEIEVEAEAETETATEITPETKAEDPIETKPEANPPA
jgi:signal recognition particle receptor subunit beta